MRTINSLWILHLLIPLTFCLSMSCGGGDSFSSTSIEENNPPQLDFIGDKTLFEGETLSFRVTAADPDNDLLIIGVYGMPADSTFADQTFEWETVVGDAGIYSITFEVIENGPQPLNDTETITITVVPLTDKPTMQYGLNGPFTLEEETFQNSIWADGVPVSVLLPVERAGRVPVVFYSHAYGGTDWHNNESLLIHLVSLGVAVVFSPYPTDAENIQERYDILWNGFEEAADNHPFDFDLSKVGFIGHSFGGGAIPSMAWKGLVEKHWGGQSALIFIMAPWYVYEIDEAQLSTIPDNTYMLIQVYDQDTINDHRMALDIFNSISIDIEKKSYCNVPLGVHTSPNDRENNEIDRYAIREVLDALIDCAFEIDRPLEGKSFALDGSGEHLFHRITKNPAPVNEENYYEFAWSSILNERYVP